MNYRITGVDAKTGAERIIEMEAAAEATALASAKTAGIFPYRCDVLPDPARPIKSAPAGVSDARKTPDNTAAAKESEIGNTDWIAVGAACKAKTEAPVRCPHCRSTQITANTKGFGLGKATVGGVLLGPVGLLGGLIGSRKVKITCLKCGHSWAPGG
jgi:hypothetical protein